MLTRLPDILILGFIALVPLQAKADLPSLGALATSSVESTTVLQADSSGWIRPSGPSDPLIWGRPDGIVFGLPSEGGLRGPRGLIRLGTLGTSATPLLINFIAIEPVVKGPGPRHTRMAFSELEMSELDPGERGKRLWTPSPGGEIFTSGTAQCLRVRIEVEPFTANRAHVYVIATMQSDRPDEVHFSVHHHTGSAPIEELTLTATMGNKERLRYLWLKDQIVDSRRLYKGYLDDHFIEKHPYPARDMLTWDGDPVVLSTTNEANPAGVVVYRRPSWSYPASRLTQYWRVPRHHVEDNLRTRVNARRVYWAGKIPIPGGLSFENFEVRQRYVPGQVFIFGMTPKEPHDFQPPIENLPVAPELE